MRNGKEPSTRQARICFFDIESTNLVADFGTLLCTSWKWAGDRKVHTLAITDYSTFDAKPWDDKALVRGVAQAISEADILVSWYGLKFDIPFLQTRLLFHRLKPMPPIPHVDGWRIARYQMRMSNNRIKTVSDFMGLEEKTPVKGQVWVKARSGHRPSVRYVIKHCEGDVRILEQAYERIKPLCRTHPNVALATGQVRACPICGHEKLQKRGVQIARTRMYQRYQCQKCGGWSRSRSAEKRLAPDVR